MTADELCQKSRVYLEALCNQINERCVGSKGNIQATYFFERELSLLGWETEMAEFDAIEWIDNGATLRTEEKSFNVLVSPYSLDFKGVKMNTAINKVNYFTF